MAKWNETTRDILELLKAQPRTVDELKGALECSRSNIETPILKLFRAGRVDREADERGVVVLRNPGKGKKPVQRIKRVYIYHLTDAGISRLEAIRKDQGD